MSRHFLLPLFMVASQFVLSGCAEAPVKVNDNIVEKPLQQVTGITTSDVQKASQKTELGLWDVYALAAERTERLTLEVENNVQADALSSQAVGAVLPHVSLAASKNYLSDRYVGPSGVNTGTSTSSLYLTGTQALLTGLNEVAGIAGAQANSDLQKFKLKHDSGRLLLDVAQVFYTVLQLEEKLKTQTATRDLTKKTLDQLKKWRNVGRSRESEVLSTEAQWAQVIGGLKNTEDQLKQARENLASLTGLKPDTALVSADENVKVPPDSLSEAEAKAAGRFDVKAAGASVALANASLLQAHGEHLPSLSVLGNYYMLKDGGPVPEWNIQLVASLPIFQGGQIASLESQMASRKRQAEMNLSLTERLARQEIREAYQSLADLLQEVEAYGRAQEAAEAAYKAVDKDYRLSLTTNLEVLQSLQTLESAKNNYAQARYQALVSQIWLGVATGELPKTGK